MAGYSISTDAQSFDISAIHAYLTRSYWSPGIPREVVERAIANSLCFGVFNDSQQVGFARVITDRATFAYLADVFILEAHRGKGLAKWLVRVIQAHEDLQGLRRFMLMTRDAQKLYRQLGFDEIAHPSHAMEIRNPHAYVTKAPPGSS
ncbi:MAG TPA: GNAT family N-acetyltransferase [Usitatibacter sp.]|nr:GNAT family N-acetyltransferase [Usitatibacter sp.]